MYNMIMMFIHYYANWQTDWQVYFVIDRFYVSHWALMLYRNPTSSFKAKYF